VAVKEIIKHITTKYPPEPEEVTAVEATLREQWDPTNHIENLFQAVKEGIETLYQMKAITKKESDTVFIKYVYIAISNSGQFDTACLKWKALPEADRSTNLQCCDYFEKKYDIFESSQNSLASGPSSARRIKKIVKNYEYSPGTLTRARFCLKMLNDEKSLRIIKHH
jgi:hypothetical protein